MKNKAKIHKLADVQPIKIGENTSIWQYCVVLKGATIGSNCNICSHVFIENDVVIGNGVTIKNGVKIFDSIYIEDNVFIGPNVTFTNDRMPRSRRTGNRDQVTYPRTLIKSGASIGGGAVILPGITVGEQAIIGAGAIVAEDVPEGAIVIGNKGKFHRQAPDL